MLSVRCAVSIVAALAVATSCGADDEVATTASEIDAGSGPAMDGETDAATSTDTSETDAATSTDTSETDAATSTDTSGTDAATSSETDESDEPESSGTTTDSTTVTPPDSTTATPTDSTPPDSTPPDPTPVEFPLAITDAVGRDLVLEQPARIGCFWTGCTEIHADLGVPPAAAPVPADTPADGSFYFPFGPPEFTVEVFNDLEAWAGANIDFVANRGPESPNDAVVEQFVEIVYLHAPGLTDTALTGYDAHIANLRIFGQLLGLPTEAEAAIDRLEMLTSACRHPTSPTPARSTPSRPRQSRARRTQPTRRNRTQRQRTPRPERARPERARPAVATAPTRPTTSPPQPSSR